MRFVLFFLVTTILFFSCRQKSNYDTIIRNGMIYDGNGGEGYKADVAINADTIAFIGDLSNESANNEIDANCVAMELRLLGLTPSGNRSILIMGHRRMTTKLACRAGVC